MNRRHKKLDNCRGYGTYANFLRHTSFDFLNHHKEESLLTLTKKDFRVDTFRAGGKGGQNQNKRDTGVRITHKASGISAESRSERSQAQNKKIAFRRLCDNKKFKNWLKIESLHAAEIDRKVEEGMKPENLKIEIVEDGEWT